jgi:hypothetical protein
MRGFSIYGCGLMQLGLRRDPDGLEMTRWLTVLYLPLIPLSRWRVRPAGVVFPPEHHVDESFRFYPVERLPLGVLGVLQTAVAGWLLVAVAVAPAIVCALTVEAPVNPVEFAIVMATCAWPLAVFIWVQRRAKAIVRAEI